MRAWEATVEICREHECPGFMYGDEWLAHQIAERLKWKHDAWFTTRRLLRALSKTPGQLQKQHILLPGSRRAVLSFTLPEELK